MLIERLGNPGKALYKTSTMSHEAKEGPNLSVSLQRCILSYGFNVDVTGSDACFRHLVSQIVDLLPKQTALRWF